ncbi:MAG: ATP-dependent protease ATPase subunit HslU [Phycisphaerales bacterium]|nr:MAG: ATP-dependent protease ATPase subunit HslU [Phycisphaerales bacterium]
MQQLTPRQIVEALNRHIIGQDAAKRAVAVAVRNRWRRQQLPDGFREEVGPSNIIMIGPTGVGKTEIARRLANLVNAPFIKVEATKYTEVGYHGRDVESMIRELLELAIHMVRQEQTEVVRVEAERQTEEQLLDLLMPSGEVGPLGADSDTEIDERRRRNREKLRNQLRAGEFDDREVNLTIETKLPPIGMMTLGVDQLEPDMRDILERIIPSQSKSRRLPIREARKIIFEQECDNLIDREKVTEMAIRRTENSGIIFLDELDKLAGSDKTHGPDVSRQGVQRDLLPIVEGCTVHTRYGAVKTDHILFIAAGAFHGAKPSDLMPELQGRLPIRVELEDLTREDFIRILTEPENALTKQHKALLGTEGLKIEFTKDGIATLAETAFRANETTDNIGARRLNTVVEKVMEDVSFDAPEREGETIVIDKAYVEKRLKDIIEDQDLSRFIL